ncbi:hypothetical protein ACVIGB_001050 [Bradyrhizobium sp. USDA 4341]
MSGTTTIERVETLISNDGKVAVVVPMMPAQAIGYRLIDAENLVFALVGDGAGAGAHAFGMAETAQGAWQILVDTENLFVVELGEELMSLFDERGELAQGILQELARLQQLAEDISQRHNIDVFDPASRAQSVRDGLISADDAKALPLIERNVRDYELAPV